MLLYPNFLEKCPETVGIPETIRYFTPIPIKIDGFRFDETNSHEYTGIIRAFVAIP